MEISASIAQTIVSKLKGALQHEINLFDTRGVVIASTDHSRIGGVHEAAQLAIERRRTIAVHDNNQFVGARPGINAPVMIGNQVVAVVGITGQCDEVAQYGDIIRKMTEILIRENLDQHTRFDRRLMQANLIDMITREIPDTVSIAYLASALAISLDRPRTVIVGRFDHGVAPQHIRESIVNHITGLLEQSPQSIWSAGAGRCVMLVDTQEVHDIDQQLQTIVDTINQQYIGAKLRFGIGTQCTQIQEYAKSHELANRALQWSTFTQTQDVAHYNTIDLGMVITALPKRDAQYIIQHVLGNIDEHTLDEYSAIMRAYSTYNGAITKAAQSLYIHKNTLQNKLNTIAQVTGYNPRNHKDYALLTIAFTLRDWLAFTNQPVHRIAQ